MNHLEKATFGAGCFWCVEAVFERIEGVQSVVAGYAGGTKANPTYKEVCTGTTGHAEVARITYDPAKVSYEKLLEVFWGAHDPTTLNRQGADVGAQYRSVIFYHDEKQKIVAEKSKIEAQKKFRDPIVTEIKLLNHFYEAEDYHQDYFRNNPDAPYCRFVIKPKLEKLHLK
ncbi:MAG: peptide-methionine (S)-S-oxide reductase MsrA [Bacteroidota bacterium]